MTQPLFWFSHRSWLTMRPSVMHSCLLFALALSINPQHGRAQESKGRPNILVVFSDDQGMHDIGCYGSEIPTPHLDQVASEGMKFTQFYAASSICTPSRFGLLTGKFAHRSTDFLTTALMFMAPTDADRGIRPHETTYVSLLQQSGYQTHLVGKWHLGHGDAKFWPTEHGFDTFFGHTGGCVDFHTLRYGNLPDWYRGDQLVEPGKYATDAITDEAVRVLESSARQAAPWYLHVAYNAPHFGKGYDPQLEQPENVMQPKPSDLERVSLIKDDLRRSFAAKVVGMDDGIGRLMAALERSGQASNTLVVFMTDHGGDPNYGGSNQPFRGGKATLYEGGLRVPCIVRWPAVITAGRVTDQVVSALDWFPTFVSIAGATQTADSTDSLDGRSIESLLRGAEEPLPARPIVWQTGSHTELARKSWLAVRDGPWKLVQPPDQTPQLYRIDTDPFETKDLAKLHPEQIKRLMELAR